LKKNATNNENVDNDNVVSRKESYSSNWQKFSFGYL